MNQRIAWHSRLRDALNLTEQAAIAVAGFVTDHFLLLPIGALVALAWANTEGESYFSFAHAMRFAVNDIGMMLFVGLVTQEIVEAVVPGGALYHWRRTLLPVVAAIGGVLGSVSVYLLYIRSQYEFVLLRGWPVAAAEDVAFAYFIAKAIFNSHRRGPVAFLLIVAIVSDALGILSIAIWYPAADAYPAGLVLMAVAVGLAVVLRAARVRAMWPYLVFSGTLSWLACYWGGIQPALALVPVVPFLPHRPRGLDLFADGSDDGRSAPGRFEQIFRYPVQIVLLFFGLVNGGVVLAKEMPGAWGVLVAALVGRPLGILAAVGLAVAMGLRLPERLRWRELIVVSLSASAGFAFALFFATAVVPAGPVLGDLKLGALSTIVGALIAFAAARLLRVGRFAPIGVDSRPARSRRATGRHAHAAG
jgi:Na+:H+ antiporter, NhaA family